MTSRITAKYTAEDVERVTGMRYVLLLGFLFVVSIKQGINNC